MSNLYQEWDDTIEGLKTDLACYREENDRILAELARVTAEREQLAAQCQKFADSECDKIIAMSDEQIKALSAFQGHHPQDEAALGKQAAQLALLRHELICVTAERDDANTQLVRLRTLWERAGKSETPTLIALRAERDAALADAKLLRQRDALRQRYSTLAHAVWHALDDSEERDENGHTVNVIDASELIKLVPWEDHEEMNTAMQDRDDG